MTITILTKDKTRLRVKEVQLAQSESKILGTGIDVMTLPDGHLSCSKCSGYKFECWVYLDNHRIEMGCMGCGDSCRLLFPYDISLPGNGGRYSCKRHPKGAMIVIHNTDVLCIGCELCSSQMLIQLRTKSNLILAD